MLTSNGGWETAWYGFLTMFNLAGLLYLMHRRRRV